MKKIYLLAFYFFICLKAFTQSAPVFIKGATQSFTVCQNSQLNFLSQVLKVKDIDINDTLTFTIKTNPTKGILIGFPNYIISTGDTTTANYFSYKPNANYSGTDMFVIQLSDGSHTVQTTVNVTVQSLPAVGAITGNDSVCINKTTTLTNSTANGTWQSSNTNIAIVSNGLVIPLKEGTVAVSYAVTTTNGCSNWATKNIRILSVPKVAPITGITSFCIGQSTKLFCATTGGTWSSTNDYAFSVDSNGNVGYSDYMYPNLTNNADISYLVAGSNGCVGESKINVTANSHPIITAITGMNATCVGTTIQLTDTTIGGIWSSTNTAVATVSNTGLVIGMGVGLDTITYTIVNGNNCKASTSYTVQVGNTLPIDSIVGDTAICRNNPYAILSCSTLGGVWASSNVNAIAVSSAGVISGPTTGSSTIAVTISYTVSIAAGCTGVSTKVVKLKPKLNNVIIIAPSTVCTNDTVTLTASVPGGIWSLIYSGTVNRYATIDSFSGLLSVTTPFGGTSGKKAAYVHYATHKDGCALQGFINIYFDTSIKALSTPIVYAANRLCVSQTALLSNATAGGKWFSTDTTVLTIDSINGIAQGKKKGVSFVYYIVKQTLSCGSFSFIAANVEDSLHLDSSYGLSKLCVGSSTLFKNYNVNGVWLSSDTNIATVDRLSGTVVAKNAGTCSIICIVTNGNCSKSVATTLTVYDNPSLPANTIGTLNNIVCLKSKIQINNSVVGGIWLSGDTSKATIDSSGWITTKNAGNVVISYSVTNAAGCSAFSKTNLQIVDLPVVPKIIGDSVICINNKSAYQNSNTLGIWSTNNNVIALINNNGLLIPKSTGNTIVNYTVSNNYGCKNSDSLKINIYTKPEVSLTSNSPVESGQTLNLIAAPIVGNIVQFNWLGANNFISNAQNPNILNATAINAGNYLFIGKDDKGCITDTMRLLIEITDSLFIAGKIVNPLRKIVNNVIVNTYSNSASQSIVSNSNGYKLHSAFNSNIILKFAKNNDATKANGVNSVDALLVQRHILNTTKLNNAYKLIAADVDGNRAINSVDVLRIKRLILGTDTTFKNTITNENRLWAFVDSAYQFPDTTNPFPFKDSISFTNLTSSKTNQTFTGVKLGDVNYDWNSTVAKQSTANSQPMTDLELVVNSEKLATNNVQLTFASNNFNNIAALQTTLHFDNTKYEFVFIQNGKLNLDYNTNKANETGNIALLWTDKSAEAKNFDKDEVLFTVVLKPKSTEDIDATSLNKLSITNDFVESLAIDESLNQKNITLSKKLYIIHNTEVNPLINIYPNPSNGKINIQVNKIKEIQFTDFWGRNIKRFSINDYSKTSFIVDLPKGVYLMKCISQIEVITKKIIIE